MMKCLRAFFLGALLSTLTVHEALAGASLVLTPRLEGVSGQKQALAQRGLLRGRGQLEYGPYGIYLEGFAEGELSAEERDRRRIGEVLFLQEAYLEFKLGSFYVRAGKQALRWSEMWVLPSLDIWTARRWNRFLFDPQPEQLEHSGGFSASWATDRFTFEGAVISELAKSRYPQPFPEILDEKAEEVSGGGRAKVEVGGFGLSGVVARAGMKDVRGVAINHAFESWVPKLEVGQTHDYSVIPLGAVDDTFCALGADLFWGTWTLQPQMTVFDFGNRSKTDPQTVIYLSGTWQKDRHDFQFQTFGNTTSEDFFLNLFYGYNWKDWLQTAAFVQNYSTKTGLLFKTYQDVTGGWVAGLRLEMNTSIGD